MNDTTIEPLQIEYSPITMSWPAIKSLFLLKLLSVE